MNEKKEIFVFNVVFFFLFEELGLRELETSAFSQGLRAPLAALFLLGYHTFAGHIFGNGDGDLKKSHQLAEHYLNQYPKVRIELLNSISFEFFFQKDFLIDR